MTAPGYFQDRHVETELIGAFLREDGMRMMSVVGRGGVGKTAMVCRLLKALEEGRLPDDLGQLEVDGIVYLSPLSAHPVDFLHLFSDLCRLLPEEVAEPLLELSHDPQETPAALMQALLGAFPTGRSVLLLDNFEDVVDAEGVGLTDAALDEALRAVLTAPEHGVKVIITTRVAAQSLLLLRPGIHRRLNLDEGLPSPFAEEVMRAMDGDGSLGIRDAPDSLLAQARERTRGFPRALEALAAILAADRNTTLPELVAATEQMPENVVEALVGEAFNRLDGPAQHVMQALAIYPGPVPAVAVDYLLQPTQPAIDSAPVLGRLVNMQFVRRDGTNYYLHQVDRDYALQRVPTGEPGDRDADVPPFTQYALHERAADYFQQTRTPRETWHNLDDLAPQLAEFELRSKAGDYDTAAQVLFEISLDYLQLWGHARLSADLHERLRGRISDPFTNAVSLSSLASAYFLLGEVRGAIELSEEALPIFREVGGRGGEGAVLSDLGQAYNSLGEVPRAIEFFEQSVAIFREIGGRSGEGTALIGLGQAYYALGEVRRAIDIYEQALAIHREIGARASESSTLINLANAYDSLGEVRHGIELYEQALPIVRETGDRSGEGIALTNLAEAVAGLGEVRRAIEIYEQALPILREIGERYGDAGVQINLGHAYCALGDVPRGIAFYERALTIFREIGRRSGEGFCQSYLCQAHTDLGDWPRAIQCGEDGVRIADEDGFVHGSSEGRVHLAIAHLHAGDYARAQATALEARGFHNPRMSDNVALVLGIALACDGQVAAAREAFDEALNAAEGLLAQTADAYDELDNRGLALCGLALVEGSPRVSEACETFRAARKAASADGIVARVLRLFDAIAMNDEPGVLAPVRPVAAGEVEQPVEAP